MVRTESGLFLKVQNLINNGIKSCAIIQTPDWNGGHDQSLCFSKDETEDWYDGLGDFEYVEWIGRPIDLLKDEPWLNYHKEPFHEEPYDGEYPWWAEL